MSEHTKYYDILGITNDASPNDVKVGYRKMAKKYHPDKNADGAEHFKKISEAYETLSDPQKREIYDKYGEDGMKHEGVGSGNDIFDMFFGGRGKAERKPERGADMQHKIDVELKEFYCGSVRTILIRHKEKCVGCDGKGGRNGANVTCEPCKGRGIQIKMRTMGFNMVQQMQSTCSHCKGRGVRIKASDMCKICKGEQFILAEKTLKVEIKPGMKHDDKVEFVGEADYTPGVEKKGNVYIFLKELEHDVYTRDKEHLIMSMDISLNEALTGFVRYIDTMDGRTIKIQPPTYDSLIKPDEVLVINNEGMPRYNSKSIRGLLKIKFNVLFPSQDWYCSMSENNLKLLNSILPAVPNQNTTAAKVDEVSLKRHSNSNGNAKTMYDEEDENEARQTMGGQNVQCASQ